MAYTTVTAELAAKNIELSERVGETISQKELAEIQAKYLNKPAKAKVVEAPKEEPKKKTRKPRKTTKKSK